MSSTTETQAPAGRARRWTKVLLPLAVLIIGVGVATALVKTGPKAKREAPPRQARLVQVQDIAFADAVTRVEAMGTVAPARRVALQPQVSGEVTQVSADLEPGGRFRTGEELLRIDARDYELAVLQRESEVAQAQSALRLELGQQDIARREFELLGETLPEEDRDLVLRKPQLDDVRARLAMAEAALDKAKLDLQRTRVRAPFNAIVESRAVDPGARVTTASTLVTLAGTDRCWVEVSVPVSQLQWIAVAADGKPGSRARIYNPAAWGPDAWREGEVIRMSGSLEQEGRMAQLLVVVDDPFALKAENQGKPVLLNDSYVTARIEGRALPAVASIARGHVRDGDRVWIMGDDDTLEIRKVDIVFRGQDRVLVSGGVEAGERLVITDLAAPVDGMPLRRADAQQAPAATAQGEGP